MTTASAKQLANKVVEQRARQDRNKRTPPHPDEIRLLRIDVDAALALSNVQLAEALVAFTEAAGKNTGSLKETIAALTTRIAALAKR